MRAAYESVAVKVPGTSGNLGPGFDCLGMAHDIWDDVEATLMAGGSSVTIIGEGQDTLPRDESHLIVRALHATLEWAGAPLAGVRLTCHNRIPHGRGLGSSAAAAVAGVLLGAAFIDRPDIFTKERILSLATDFEGHPDNAAPAVYGGAVVSWMSGVDDSGHIQAHAEPLRLHSDIRTCVLVPSAILPTSAARAVLPANVPLGDAVFNLSRTAMMIQALQYNPSLLMDASEDRLHQGYRAASMPATAEMISALRDAGWPAVVSGAGPSILVLDDLDPTISEIIAKRGWKIVRSADVPGAQITRQA